ncbi:EF-Tu/IF-2/RF-3 family GTPase [Kribbella sp. NPDC049174]|uniref:EF-Tu/IF-2/RF-3 family GTPase n=1 Tax=Kribbella sp. NPDC049174 TaxID=3364112 RepID=UPI003715D174
MGWKFWKRDSEPPVNTSPGTRPQDVVPAGGFGLTIEDVFSITGRGTIVTGRVTAGTVAVGDQVLLSRAGTPLLQTEVTGIEMFRKTVGIANAGDNVGLLLRDVRRDQVISGDVLSK